jgi:hypothetical protein
MSTKWFCGCPVCGYDRLSRPPYNDGGGASFEICPCCGVQFGYQDCGFPHAALRRIWLAGGGPWHSDFTRPPDGWSALGQLRRAGLASDPVDECPYCRTPVVAGEPVGNWAGNGTAGLRYAATCEGCGGAIVGAGRAGGETPEQVVWGAVE